MIKLLFVFLSWSAAPADSLRLETVDGKQFIIHQIDAKETLYSISRRYGVPVTTILESNPSSEGGISVGKLLRVPYLPKSTTANAGSIHIVAQGETLYSIARQYTVSVEELKKWNNLTINEISLGQTLRIDKKVGVAEAPKLIAQKSVSSVHTVAAKETLYSLARQYNISVQQLKEWNNLTTDELKVGSMVYVVRPTFSTSQQPVVSPPQQGYAQAAIKVSEKIIGTDEVKEQGMAELLTGTEGNRKYLAQHRTIKPGTILKVHNTLNNQEVFVRISGVLPSTADTDVLMRMSKSACDRLGATEAKFNVEVTYYK
jgi:LysM repeat protein